VFKHVSPSESVPTGRLRKEMPIHVSNVSLVHPDTKMAVKIETRRLVDAKTGKLEARRFVRGTDIEVPKVKHMEYQNDWMEGELDTLAEEVAKVTFIPSLDTPPLPASVVNELRNKYSKHRPEKEKKRAAIALAQ
jgi:large subunit ribosomal protein L24